MSNWLRNTFVRKRPDAPAPAAAPVQATVPWIQQGNAALAAGNLAEAARCYGQGLQESPQDGPLLVNLGFVLMEQGQFAAAAERLRQALAVRRPGDGYEADAHFLLARAQAAQRHLPEALASFDAAAGARSGFVEALQEGAGVLQALDRHAEAVQRLERALQLQPTPAARMLLAQALHRAGRHAEAADLLEQVVAEEPRNIDVIVLRHHALVRAGRFEEALVEIDRAHALVVPDAALWVNRSVPLERLRRYDESLACLDRALALEPGHRQALVNRATVLLGQLRIEDAVAATDAALRLHPEDGDLHWIRGFALLLRGDYARGWPDFDWRSRSANYRGAQTKLPQPVWQGERLEGRTILLHAEQGFGDTIQFLRFVPRVAKLARTVLLVVPEAMEPLVRGQLPVNVRLVPPRAVLPHVDYQSSLMSLPRHLGVTLDALPGPMPYLRADPAAVQRWRDRIGTDGFRIGIAWAGNPAQANDRNRSMPLAMLREIAAPGCRFFTLQPQLREGDRELLADWPEAVHLGAELHDFGQTAALVEALDLVVSVDTSSAHLAGAMGKPVWILLTHAADWRYLLQRTDSPWYPSARLYRQPVAGDWATPVAQARADLAALAAQR